MKKPEFRGFLYLGERAEMLNPTRLFAVFRRGKKEISFAKGASRYCEGHYYNLQHEKAGVWLSEIPNPCKRPPLPENEVRALIAESNAARNAVYEHKEKRARKIRAQKIKVPSQFFDWLEGVTRGMGVLQRREFAKHLVVNLKTKYERE